MFRYSPIKLLFLFCLSYLFSQAQNKKIDSLNLLLKNDREDTTKVNHLSALMREYLKPSPDKVIEISKEALALAKKLNHLNGQAEINTWMGSAYQSLGKTKEALTYLKTAREISSTAGNFLQFARALLATSFVNSYLGEFPQALENAERTLKILDSINGDKKLIGNVYNQMGNTYADMGNRSAALTNLLISQKISIQLNDNRGLAASYNNIGNLYKTLRKLQEALDLYEKAIKINLETDNKSWLANNYTNIGLIYQALITEPLLVNGMRDKRTPEDYIRRALKCYDQSLKIKQALGDKNATGHILNNIALMERLEGLRNLANNKDEAIKKLNISLLHFKEVLAIRQETGDKHGLSKAYSNMALLYKELGNSNEAKRNYQLSINISKEIGGLAELSSSHYALSKLDSATGNYKEAYFNLNQHNKYKDLLANEEVTRQLVQTQMLYDFDIKQTADSLKNLEKTNIETIKHGQEIKHQKIYTYGGILGFLLMIIVAAISFKAYRQKQKANSIITEQKLLVEQKQKEILDSIHYAKRIQQSLLPQEKYIQKKLEMLTRKDEDKKT